MKFLSSFGHPSPRKKARTYTCSMRMIVLLTGLLPLITGAQELYHKEVLADLTPGSFAFGVASGDPRPNTVVLWTKYLPQPGDSAVMVNYFVALDSLFTATVGSGAVEATAQNGFTVLVEPQSLAPGTRYYYRFTTANGVVSEVGRTRTAPEDPSALRFAVVSCAQYGDRYYNGYALIAERNDIDAVIHLGDYIYEQGSSRSKKRPHLPAHSVVNARDYRTRYAQYRLDPDLRELHRLHPMIAIWDDHEFANNSHRDGAGWHSASEGTWERRKAAAMAAYFEWIPVMFAANGGVERRFDFGNLAELYMIDGRMERDKPVADYRDPERFDPNRSKLGDAQTERLTEWLRDSNAHWKIMGNNVMFSEVDLGRMARDIRFNMDAWDGYPANRNQIYDTLDAHAVRNLLVLTGDIHTAWGIELTRSPRDKQVYRRKAESAVYGAEFVSQSVSSFNVDEFFGRVLGKLAGRYMGSRRRNPHVHYRNVVDHGYLLIELTREAAVATWHFTRDPYERTLDERPARRMVLPHGGRLGKVEKLKRVRR